MRPASEVWRHANRASLTANNKQGGALAAATAIIEADGADLVAEIVAWLRSFWDGDEDEDLKLAATEIEAKWGKV